MQSYVMFRKWNVQDEFSFTAAIVAVAFALANIWVVPLSSPCFEDSRGLASKPSNRSRQQRGRELRRAIDDNASGRPKEVVVE